jgi:reactive intermediate/imine deaminase
MFITKQPNKKIGSRIMEKEVLRPERLPKPGGSFSQGVKVNARDIIYISGQVPVDSEGTLVGKCDIRVQAIQVFKNLEAVLEEAGAGFDNLVKLTTYLTDISYFKTVAEIRTQFLKKEFPASTMVVVKSLVNPDWLVEIEAVAVID